jgi:hypothetical protein
MMNIILEFVKPLLARRITKRRVKRELTTEFLANFEKVETAIYILDDATQKAGIYTNKALETAPLLLTTFRSDRYQKHFEDEKSIYYEIDEGGALTNFYATAEENMPDALELKNLGLIKMMCQIMHSSGEKYCAELKISVPTFDPYWKEMYLQMPDDGTLPIIESVPPKT